MDASAARPERAQISAAKLLAVLAACVIAALGLAAAQWIPEWQRVSDVVATSLVLAMGGIGVVLFNRFRRRASGHQAPGWRLTVNVLVALVGLSAWSFAAVLVLFMSAGFPFGATYHSQLPFPEYHTTLYLYDSSFLDPSTTVFVRQGWLPLRRELASLGVAPRNVEVVLHGSTLLINGEEFDLANLE
ncbi:MAG TPA: hypothetical protein VHM70_33045 [Polyangiaceae bacterium]|nr:hypothetical protein [Polyangiaceae bacterium]